MLRALAILLLVGASALAGPAVGTRRGDVHPDFHLPKTDGSFGRLSDYRGKPVVLFHFASW